MNELAQAAARPTATGGGDNLTSLAGFARISLFIYLAVAVLVLIPQLVTLLAFMEAIPMELAILGAGFAGLLSVLAMALFALAAIAILIWLYRARQNLVEAGLEELRYSPGWSVASFFVPIANLFVPFLTMRELYNRSHGEIPELAQSSVSSVASWWSCHVTGSLVMLWLMVVAGIALVPGIYWTTPPTANAVLSLFGGALMAGSAWFMAKIIGSITQAQKSMLHVSETFA